MRSVRRDGDGGSVRELPDLGDKTVVDVVAGWWFVRCFLEGKDVVYVGSAVVFSLSSADANTSLVRLVPRDEEAGCGIVATAVVFDLID